jgi:hypothetical protein
MGGMHGMGFEWAMYPLYVKVFVLYLVVVGCLTIVRSLRLAWRLYSFSSLVSLQDIRDGLIHADRLARAALANRLSLEFVAERHPDPTNQPQMAGDNTLTRFLQAADSEFLYLLGISYIQVKRMRWLIVLTLLLGCLMATFGTSDLVRGAYLVVGDRIPGVLLLRESIFELLKPLALGILLCVILCVLGNLFDGAMARRKARWNYFYAGAKSQLGQE